MILWITGNSGAGKTTLANQMKGDDTIVLDGDDLRGIYPTGFSEEDRHNHNIRIAKLANLFHSQGFDVIVSVIAPYKRTRDEIQALTGCSFLYLKVDPKSEEYVYEYEDVCYFEKVV